MFPTDNFKEYYNIVKNLLTVQDDTDWDSKVVMKKIKEPKLFELNLGNFSQLEVFESLTNFPDSVRMKFCLRGW